MDALRAAHHLAYRRCLTLCVRAFHRVCVCVAKAHSLLVVLLSVPRVTIPSQAQDSVRARRDDAMRCTYMCLATDVGGACTHDGACYTSVLLRARRLPAGELMLISVPSGCLTLCAAWCLLQVHGRTLEPCHVQPSIVLRKEGPVISVRQTTRAQTPSQPKHAHDISHVLDAACFIGAACCLGDRNWSGMWM